MFLSQDEVIEEKMADLLPEDTLKGLASANWKERLGSMEKFTEVSTAGVLIEELMLIS